MNRPSWDEYFMELAVYASRRSTCPRKAVGAVIVRNNSVLATGYNGSVAGLEHCTDVGCLMIDNHCARTIHAEANAIIQAARLGHPIDGATLYTSAFPCWNCFKTIVNSGIVEVVYCESYRPDENVLDSISKLNYKVRQYGQVSDKA